MPTTAPKKLDDLVHETLEDICNAGRLRDAAKLFDQTLGEEAQTEKAPTGMAESRRRSEGESRLMM